MTIQELIDYLQKQIKEDEYSNVYERLGPESVVYVHDGESYQPLIPDGEIIGGNYFKRAICIYKHY